MARGFRPARFGGLGAPEVQSIKYKTAEAIKLGSLVLLDANGELTIFGGGTDATVLGVAGEPAASKPGFNLPNDNITSFVTGRVQEVSTWLADRNAVFSCRGKSTTTDPVVPTQTIVGETRGVAVDADGEWYMDMDEVTTNILRVVDIDIPNKIFFVKFLEAVLQRP